MSDHTVRLALANLQMPASAEESVALAVAAIADAAVEGADVICFPECYVPGYRTPAREMPPPNADVLEGAWTAIAAAAKESNVAVILGTERIVDGELRISALVIDRDGTRAGFQDKVQLDPSEDGPYAPGAGRRVFTSGALTFGVSICHEGWRYPETVRWAVRQGAQVVFHPHFHVAEPGGYRPSRFADPANTFHEKAALCRAAENTCFFATVNYASSGAPTTSALVGPDGTLMCFQPYGKRGLLVADIAPAEATGLLALRYKSVDLGQKRPTLEAMRFALALLVAAGVTASAQSAAPQWPQFRGPSGQGMSDTTGLPLEWSESRNITWKVPVPGRGWSSPVVGGGRVWLTTAVQNKGDASLRLLAFDAATGSETLNVEVFRVWREEFSTNAKNSNATPTPILDGDRVYVHFGASGTAAVTTEGRVVWKTRLPHDTQHGQGGSPVLAGGLLIVNCDGFEDPYVIALDAATGKTKWRQARRAPTSQAYSTPLAIHAAGRDQLISVGASFASSFDPVTGREIWRVGYRDGFSNVPRPVFAHGLVFIATGFQQPTLIAVRPDGNGDVTKTHVAWTLARGAPLTPSPIVVGDEIYVISDHGILQCLDARTGKTHWVQRLNGAFAASPIFVDGRLYFLSEDGVTTAIAPGAEFKPLARSALDGETLASIAIADQSFFIRSSTHLYRIAARK